MATKENRAFLEMLSAAKSRLAGRSPGEIANNTGVTFDPEQAVCTALGAEIEDSNADLFAQLPFLPRYPVTLKLWLAEEEDEIDGSGRLFLNNSADHYLSIEDAVTVGTLILERLRRQYEEMFPT